MTNDDRFRRVPKRAGWVNPKALPKGPNGRALCRQCGTEVPVGRVTFCGDPCVHEWKVRTQPRYARKQVEQRDAGVCSSCRLDTVVAQQLWVRVWRRLGPLSYEDGRELRRLLDLPLSIANSWWAMDHVVPVSEGGGSCGLENLRTLCHWCHREETRRLRARLKNRAVAPT